jgi:caffeoyl-CoA O-methyltransferase
MSKYTRIDDALHAYLTAHRSADDPILAELAEETRRLTGQRSVMQIAPEEGTLLALLVAATGAKRVVEVGTFTGYSALCMARALPPGGKLLACDVSEEYTAVARRYWQKAGVADRIELVLGPGADTLRRLPDGISIDFAFIDADKTSYRTYYEEILKRLRPNGLIAIDNVLWNGQVIRADDRSDDTRAIRELNDFVATDPRVQAVLIGVSDGITLARKLG